MSKSDVLDNVHALKPQSDVDPLPLIPPGLYSVAFDYFETAIQFVTSQKVIMHFHIVDYGQSFNTQLARYHTVRRVIGKPSRGGCFKVSQTSMFMIEYHRCLRDSVVRRFDRVPMAEWPKHIYKARVATVTKNSQQKSLPSPIQYSKIAELIGIADE